MIWLIRARTLAIVMVLPLIILAFFFVVFRMANFDPAFDWSVAFTFQDDQLLDFYGTTFGQAFLGASYGAVGAFYAVTEHGRREAAASLSREILQLVHDPAFVDIRRNAASFLMNAGYVDENENPVVENCHGFSQLFANQQVIEGTRIIGATEVRKVMAQIELIGDLCGASAVDVRILKNSIGDFMGYWLRHFKALEDAETNPSNWRGTMLSLGRAQKTFRSVISK